MRPTSPPNYLEASDRASPDPAKWEQVEFPSHSAKPKRTQTEHLYSMLQGMLRDLEVEIEASGEAMDARERIARERRCYELAGTELCRQL